MWMKIRSFLLKLYWKITGQKLPSERWLQKMNQEWQNYDKMIEKGMLSKEAMAEALPELQVLAIPIERKVEKESYLKIVEKAQQDKVDLVYILAKGKTNVIKAREIAQEGKAWYPIMKEFPAPGSGQEKELGYQKLFSLKRVERPSPSEASRN